MARDIGRHGTMYRKTKAVKDFVVCRESLQRHLKAAHTRMNVSCYDWRTMIRNMIFEIDAHDHIRIDYFYTCFQLD